MQSDTKEAFFFRLTVIFRRAHLKEIFIQKEVQIEEKVLD